MTDFVQITYLRSCTGFTSAIPTGLPDYHPTTASVGEKGCVAIVRDPEGGFDIYGEGNQHYWVSSGNVVWARKSERIRPTDVLESKKIEPVVVQAVAPVVEPAVVETMPYLSGPEVKSQPEPKKRGRPRK